MARKPGHDEVKAGFRELLVEEFDVERHALDFERRVPEIRGRLDALIGRTVLEAKSDLDREWEDVTRRMPAYLADREREEGQRFVGVASDGLNWAVLELDNGVLVTLKRTQLDPEKPELFLSWLDGALALKNELAPDPLTIRLELGQDSVAYRRASSALMALWERLKDEPAVALKRQLWAQLLKLVYGKDVETDALWFQHTFLVVVAKAIAVAVLELREDDPKRLLSGRAFEDVGISGAVESDFFDWVVADPQGEDLVRRIMAHVRRFRLGEVQTDVLKVLYESLIDRDERHGLGEYYTPDWLASKVVRRAVERPLEQRVLDPACGSGTFLFHAIRRFLSEAEDADLPAAGRAREAADKVAGMDIHPVAVIIARVTYLLALAPVLPSRAGALSIPVYLGDAMQLSISDVMGLRELTVRVPPRADGSGATKLDFPDTFCRDPGLFDKTVEAMRAGSEAGLSRRQFEAGSTRIVEQHFKRDLTKEEKEAVADLGTTFDTFDQLRREGRDTVWAYVARNLSRPLAFAAGGGWAQVLVGNPPWVAYRHMSPDLQKRFKELAQSDRVYVGGKLATQNDLCALFTVRAVALYLRAAGRLAFVLPLAVLTRGQFERLRSGSFSSARLAYDEAWTMDDSVQPLFPVPSCVLFGRRRAVSSPVPPVVTAFSGTLPFRDAPETVADRKLTAREGAPRPSEAQQRGGSSYRAAFRNGATLYPRMLCFVERKATGRLGSDASSPTVTSRRTGNDKGVWKTLASIESRVEAEFLLSTFLGESILPYRAFQPFEAVIPVTPEGEVLTADGAANRGYTGLHEWMTKAEALWNQHRPRQIDLVEQLDHYGKLKSQFPLPALRVVYAKSGSQPAAMVLRDRRVVVDHMLYWFATANEDEALYLCAILNSETARAQTAALQARGLFGARHFDKVVFSLPIPRFDPAKELHVDLVSAAQKAELAAAAVVLPEAVRFQRARKLIRAALVEREISSEIEGLVRRLLGIPDG
ncbi:N-6 DNA methylase [Enterovirga sp. CN4-39]|uniref:N-6 DNA methylase n=1 Tax=Enterovirga sp. CN4-39 TaxID=3400910 RepID=UPI003C00630E